MDEIIVRLQDSGVSTLATELYTHLRGGTHIKNLGDVGRRIISGSQCTTAHAKEDLTEFLGLAYRRNWENERNYKSFNKRSIEI